MIMITKLPRAERTRPENLNSNMKKHVILLEANIFCSTFTL